MVQINFARKEINCKIVYYGPGLSGKTTNLEVVHERAPEENKGELTSISTDGDRTLFFDFMPLDLGEIAGMHTKFHIYTVPGQVYYNSTRKLVLLGADGVIFVADSSPGAMEANKQSLENLAENLLEMGKDIAKVPLVIQYNKRDLEGVIDVETMEKELNRYNAPCFEAVASQGTGVFQTLKTISSLVLESINSNERKGNLGPAEIPGATGIADAQPLQEKAAEPFLASKPSPAPTAEKHPVDSAEAVPITGVGPGQEAVGKGMIERNHIPLPQDVVAAGSRQPGGGPGRCPENDLSAKPVAELQSAVAVAVESGEMPDVWHATESVTQQEQPVPPEAPVPAGKTKPYPVHERDSDRGRAFHNSIPSRYAEQSAKPAGTARERSLVIGGKPKKAKVKNNNTAMGVVLVISVVLMLAAAGVAYFLMV